MPGLVAIDHEPAHSRVPLTYYWWLFGVTWTLAGMAILAFGLVWIATGISGTAAALVLSSGVLTRLVLSIPGGSFADRFGAWPIMVLIDCVMAVFSAVLAVTVLLVGTPLWLLIGVSVILGVADAFYRPASGAFPRHLVPAEAMRQASAARQIVFQLIGLAGPALGALVVVTLSLTGSALAAAAGFVLMLAILLTLRSKRLPVSSPVVRESLSSSVKHGIRYAATTPRVRAILILLVAITGFVLPLTSLLIPVHVRDQSWPGVSAGLLAGSFAAGLLISSTVFLLRPHSVLTRAPSLVALVITAGGMLAISLAPSPELGAVGTVSAGIGTGYFIARVAPALLTEVPDQYLARVQGLNLFAQTLPLLFTNSLFGWISDVYGSTAAIQFACCGLFAATVALAVSKSARTL